MSVDFCCRKSTMTQPCVLKKKKKKKKKKEKKKKKKKGKQSLLTLETLAKYNCSFVRSHLYLTGPIGLFVSGAVKCS